jgi:hypothetical protein
VVATPPLRVTAPPAHTIMRLGETPRPLLRHFLQVWANVIEIREDALRRVPLLVRRDGRLRHESRQRGANVDWASLATTGMQDLADKPLRGRFSGAARLTHMNADSHVIAVLEDDGRRADAMREELERLFPETEAVFFDDAPGMVAWLEDNLSSVSLLCLDHDLGPNRQRRDAIFDPGSGRGVADFLATRQPSCPVIIHSANATSAYGMRFVLEGAGWSVERVFPFEDLAWIGTEWSRQIAGHVSEHLPRQE